MKRFILKLALVGTLAFIGIQAKAQDILKMTPGEFKEYVQKMDGSIFYDNLGVTMAIGQQGNIAHQLKNGGSSDRAVYENLQMCYRMYKDYPCVPQYVVEYVLSHFDQYKNYYVNTLIASGDINDAAAANLLLTGFNNKCKAVNKSYEKFVKVCDDFNIDDANEIVADKGKNNGYRGATLMLLTAQLINKISDGSIGELSDKTKKNLTKTFGGIVSECDKALKKNNPQYNQYVSQYKEMFDLVVSRLK
ncbi:MAG: hypothetical protein IJ686_05700 [Bacteroidales bacterium]|nr:hypothetical protein [Bacteroidales bacterium]